MCLRCGPNLALLSSEARDARTQVVGEGKRLYVFRVEMLQGEDVGRKIDVTVRITEAQNVTDSNNTKLAWKLEEYFRARCREAIFLANIFQYCAYLKFQIGLPSFRMHLQAYTGIFGKLILLCYFCLIDIKRSVPISGQSIVAQFIKLSFVEV